MEWFHCNLCSIALDLASPGMPSAATCGHIFCSNCVQKVAANCPICKQSVQVSCLWDDQGNEGVANDLEAYFMPSNGILEQMQTYIRALLFQIKNYSLIVAQLRKQQKEMQQVMIKAKQELVDRRTLQAEVIRLRQQLQDPQLAQVGKPADSPSKDFKNIKRDEFTNRFTQDLRNSMPASSDLGNSDFKSMISQVSQKSKNPFYK